MALSAAQQRVASFWDEDHWRNGYKANPPNAHSGQDIGGWPNGKAIPALREGVLRHSFYDAYYGWCASLQVSASTWHLYCHMDEKSPRAIGETVSFGETVGPLGHSGAYAVGDHLHFSVSSSWKPSYRPTTNPRATINAALKKATTPAGGGGTIIIPKKDQMAFIAINKNNTNEAARRLLVTDVSANVITAEQSKLYVRGGITWAEFTREEWLQLKADGDARVAQIRGSSSGSADLAPVLAAIAAVPAAVDAILDDEQAQLLSAIGNVPAATLAAFGLKRA